MADEHRGTKRALDTSAEFTVPPTEAGDAGGAAAAEVVAPPESDASAARRIAQRLKQARRLLYKVADVLCLTSCCCVCFLQPAQIDFGKNTPGYARYTALVPRAQRLPSQPKTPDPYQQCPKRLWDSRVREWRRALHRWDPEELRVQEEKPAAALTQPSGDIAPPPVPVADLPPEPVAAQEAKADIYSSFEE